MGIIERLKADPLYQDLNWRLLLIGVVSSLGAAGFGFDNGWWGGALGLSEFKRKYGEWDPELGRYAIPSVKLSVGTGTGSAGIILGCIIAPIVTSKLGRKKAFAVMSLLMVIGIILEATAVTSFWQLVVGRIIVYSGIGLASNCVPMYLSETAPGRVRGAFLALYSFFTSFGVFLSSIIVYASRSRTDQWQYLTVILCQLFVPVGYAVFYAFLPESPRYLIYKGRFDEAEKVLTMLSNHPETVPHEVELLKAQVEEQRELHKATSVLDCFRGTNLRRTVIAMSVQILQQAQGVSFIQNFIVTFMQQLGFPDALRTNLIVTGCSFAVHIVTFLTFDKIGRRHSLSWGAIGMAGCMLGTGAATATGTVGAYTPTIANASAALLILWYCIYGFTWGPGCWVVAAEVGTGQLRERTLFLASMGSFVTSVPINFVNPYVQKSLDGAVTFIYGGFSVVAIVWVLLMIPETKNRSLEELDEMFQAKIGTRQFRKYECTGLGASITRLEGKGAVGKIEGDDERDVDRWTIDVVTPDERGVNFYMTQYKPFWLLALQESPSSFDSTYEREVAFSDNEWIMRVSNPSETTFVAVNRDDDGKILSSATLIGPLPIPKDAAIVERIRRLPSGILHWQFAAVYTRPEARRTGLAREVLRRAWEWATQKSGSQGSSCIVTADLVKGNHGAKALYERSGFSVAGESDGNIRMVRCSNGVPGRA
ncbi:related to transporter (major facilitator superfamily) [Cephalotrichum gorgonifer]|uniref:Related to transporter (Major facilitator superfamily) n=1 Tax=Cephalotrichum gorgonifer TaxID=2041049 RepID=A0AAE8N6Y4_9PEZI|nr:related to transporter (major facilitator superfamily) [Cephalotrichum gorgonifer]